MPDLTVEVKRNILYCNVRVERMKDSDQISAAIAPSVEEMMRGIMRLKHIPVPQEGWYQIVWVDATEATIKEKLWGSVIAHHLTGEEAERMCEVLNTYPLSITKELVHAIIAYAIEREGKLMNIW